MLSAAQRLAVVLFQNILSPTRLTLIKCFCFYDKHFISFYILLLCLSNDSNKRRLLLPRLYMLLGVLLRGLADMVIHELKFERMEKKINVVIL